MRLLLHLQAASLMAASDRLAPWLPLEPRQLSPGDPAALGATLRKRRSIEIIIECLVRFLALFPWVFLLITNHTRTALYGRLCGSVTNRSSCKLDVAPLPPGAAQQFF